MSAIEQANEHRLAAERAENATQWRDAIDEYEACLSIVSTEQDGAGQDEAALLTALGRCYWNLSEARTAWRTLRRAMSIYNERDDGVGFARATVEILRIWGPPERHRAMAEEAVEMLGDQDPYLRARLLLDLGWPEHGDRTAFEEALSLAETHGFQDVLTARTQEEAWKRFDEGDIEGSVGLFEQAHATYAAHHAHHPAAGVLRGAGFNLIEIGELDRGYAIAERAFTYARDVNLLFSSQLALLDMIGVAFARGEFDRCEELLALSPGGSDFRADCYRMWIAEARGDFDSALGLLVDPERAGKAPTAEGQIHASSAGVLYSAGKQDAAGQALQAWWRVDRGSDMEPFWMEAPAALECILALGDEDMHRKIYDAFRQRDERGAIPARFSTLQGRAVAPVRAGVALKLGFVKEANHILNEGLAWCERESCARDAERCRDALAEIGGRPS